ncbi:hypothetical protein [Vibrio minamisatsumaniensis]|uniref:hypothetical protein n=1 Tax=Vibrio minamisatsumaniensis TaxID=2910243 RepID=UPI003D24BBCA
MKTLLSRSNVSAEKLMGTTFKLMGVIGITATLSTPVMANDADLEGKGSQCFLT